MITDLYDLHHTPEEISKQLIKQIKYLAEAKRFDEFDKFEVKFKIIGINPYT